MPGRGCSADQVFICFLHLLWDSVPFISQSLTLWEMLMMVLCRLKISFKKKQCQTKKQRLCASWLWTRSGDSKAVLNQAATDACAMMLGVGLVVGGRSEGKAGEEPSLGILGRYSFCQLFQTSQLSARQSHNVPAQHAKNTSFVKITPLISPSLGPCLVRGSDQEASHLGGLRKRPPMASPAALPVEQRVQKQRSFKNIIREKKEWKTEDLFENPLCFPLSPIAIALSLVWKSNNVETVVFFFLLLSY